MSKYDDLVNVIDKICVEAPTENRRYYPASNNSESILQARSRGFIHLYLKVKFGLINFLEREKYITDDVDDGGIDGYYIDKENKKLNFIQSKFRANENNFENKEITLEEILSMDITRVMGGETCYESGTRYNSKIHKLIRDLQEISDIPRYEIRVILLANIKNSLQSNIKRILGYTPDIYNFEKCYNELVFPLVSGTYYNVSELKITINLDSVNTGHRIDYSVKTQYDECNVNAFFVPTLEIAKILSKYKNSILRYNPRSYLDLQAGSVNAEIANSIRNITTNEFALFNNGITMLSDNTNHSDKVGKKNKAEVIVTNPQIINGGQTAYTLSRIYDDCISQSKSLDIFENKEVLLKIITFDEQEQTFESKINRLSLIENISKATNQQSPVNEADRRANDKVQIEIQEAIFNEFGYYYERKRGEFGDGLHRGYIDRSKIIERELFLKICLAAQYKPNESMQGQLKLFALPKFASILADKDSYRKNMFAYFVYMKIPKISIQGNIGLSHSNGRYAVTTVVSQKYTSELNADEFDAFIEEEIKSVLEKWEDFQSYVLNLSTNQRYFKEVFDKNTGNKVIQTNWSAYFKSLNLISDLRVFYKV